MKKMLLNLLLICAVNLAFANPSVNELVLKQFSTAFPNVADARWFESENHYDVYFEKEGTKYNIRYNREGKILSTRNYYSGEKLCPFLKSKVAEKYAGKKIFGVTEMTNSNEHYYVIILEDETTWTNLYADGTGQMKVLEKLNKAK
jgi:hypothetical protein